MHSGACGRARPLSPKSRQAALYRIASTRSLLAKLEVHVLFSLARKLRIHLSPFESTSCVPPRHCLLPLASSISPVPHSTISPLKQRTSLCRKPPNGQLIYDSAPDEDGPTVCRRAPVKGIWVLQKDLQ